MICLLWTREIGPSKMIDCTNESVNHRLTVAVILILQTKVISETGVRKVILSNKILVVSMISLLRGLSVLTVGPGMSKTFVLMSLITGKRGLKTEMQGDSSDTDSEHLQGIITNHMTIHPYLRERLTTAELENVDHPLLYGPKTTGTTAVPLNVVEAQELDLHLPVILTTRVQPHLQILTAVQVL